MRPVRHAVIDVGTNSVKLLVAEVHPGEARPILEESRQTRLGQGFYPDHLLRPGPIELTARAVADFAAKAVALGAGSPRVIATSAVRDARNQSELTSAVARACGITVRVISGEQEADYAFKGVSSDTRLTKGPLLLLDVGGGSTEFIVGRSGAQELAQSVPLGTVRLLEQLHPQDPPTAADLAGCRSWLRDFFAREVSPRITPVLRKEAGAQAPGEVVKLVGTGGTASILACMEAQLTNFDRGRLEATRLSAAGLRMQVQKLWSQGIAERRKIIGLPANRADVILTGSAIFEAVMEQFGFQELHVSTRGLRFAVVIEAAAQSDDKPVRQ